MAVLLVAASYGCSDDDEAPAAPATTVARPAPTPTTAAPAPVPDPPDVALTVTRADVVGPGGPTHPLVDPTLTEIVDLVDRFLDVTSLHPLTGRPGPGLAEILSDDAAQRATTADRSVVFDEGVAIAPGVEALEATLDLQALAGPGNEIELVVAGLVWDVRGAAGVRRTGELTVVPTAEGWRIAAYDLAVTRT